ncbi:MAG: DNA polymerase I [Candidatus Binataceae bacterium]
MAEERAELLLVDGSGYIFRAFFALPPLNNSRGMPTNAVYGFARMLLKLLKEERPSHIGVVFDTAKKTFRDDLFEAYKANRPTPPSDLVVQIPYVHRIVEAFRIKSIMLDGYEADDVIGTLAARAARKKFNVTIVTADKDFMQLVAPSVSLWDTMRNRRIAVRDVRARFGAEPHQVVDIMALMGDPIDNVKGVPGIGEKTAAALIQKFGSIEGLLANLDRIEEAKIRGAAKLAGVIAQHRDDLELARKLVRIETDAPIALEPEELAWPGIDAAAAQTLRELEFTSLLAEIAPSAAGIPEGSSPEVVVGRDELPAAIVELAKAPRIALHLGDDKSTSSHGAQANHAPDGEPGSNRTFHFGTHPEGAPLKLKGETQDVTYVIGHDLIAETRMLLEAPTPPRTCHDLKHHLRALKRCAVELAGVDFDTMLAGFLVNPGRPEPSLAELYHQHLAPLGGRAATGSEPELVAALRNALEPRLQEHGLASLFLEIEIPVAAVLAEMEEVGIGIDAAALRKISEEFGAQQERIEAECYRLAGRKFNLNSPLQLRQTLFTDLKLPTKGLKRTKSGPSTDADALTKLAESHELPKKLLEYRTIAKLKSTYSDALPMLIDPATGRVHTSFHQALTATGRLSSTDPNLQNIPARGEEGRRIRRAFAAAPGCALLSADYSQIELRILAHLSADPTLVEAFHKGEDIHVRTATEVLGITPAAVDESARRLAKVINFGIIYGMGPQRLAGELGIALSEASEYIKRYLERLPGVRAYIEQSLATARERGFVTTMYGRRRYLPELNAPDGGARSQAERIAINTPIQGSAADLIKLAMVRVSRALKQGGLGARMVLQVHDELLFEVDQASLDPSCALVKREMEGAAQLRVPLRVDLKSGPNWAELGQAATTYRL